MSDVKLRSINIDELSTDRKNANTGNARGRKLIRKSLDECGAGRSILVDKNGVCIAGNQTLEMAKGSERVKNVKIVEVDGDTLVAVKRMDLDINDKKARELAIFDNRSSELNLSWSEEVLVNLDVDLSKFWDAKELDAIVNAAIPEVGEAEHEDKASKVDEQKAAESPAPPDAGESKYKEQYGVIVICENEDEQKRIFEELTAKNYNCRIVVT